MAGVRFTISTYFSTRAARSAFDASLNTWSTARATFWRTVIQGISE